MKLVLHYVKEFLSIKIKTKVQHNYKNDVKYNLLISKIGFFFFSDLENNVPKITMGKQFFLFDLENGGENKNFSKQMI